MLTKYVNALKDKARALEIELQDSGAKSEYIIPLQFGELVFVSSEFCELIEHAKESIPDTIAFDEAWMFEDYGWVYFEQPFLLPEMVGVIDGKWEAAMPDVERPAIYLKAFGWAKYIDGWQFACFDQGKFVEGYVSPIMSWTNMGLVSGTVLIDKIKAFEDRYKGEEAKYVDNSEGSHELKYIYTTLHLLAQRVAYHDRNKASSLVRSMVSRKSTAKSANHDVRVITLRHQAVENETGESRPVNWSHRWMVRGHWRQQPTKEGVKSIFIAAYVKGPHDKPLVNRPVIYHAKR